MLSSLATGCMVGEDEATEATPGASVSSSTSALTGCRGQASSVIPGDGRYVITTFGGPGDHQPMSCGGRADGTGWYAASRQRYGCGSKIRIEANGKCAVATTDDYGPDVCVENAAHSPIIDVSPRVSKELFGISGAGWSDHLVVTVTEVAASTPLGPCTAGEPPPPPPPGDATTCESATLGRDVEEGVCVQGASDAKWYQCQSGAWVARASSSGCATAFGFCSSATLDRDVPARTCVQAASDSKWYQCNGQGWVTPVTTATKTGPIGACSTWNPL
ncbi:MAG: hypothetical protein ABI867_08730 [Kofleriaceae bacterium]